MNIIRVGCLGAARIAPKALIHPAKVRGDVVLQAVAARDGARAADFAKAHGFAESFDDYQALIDHPEIDLIYNPLPVNLHAEWTSRALLAGKHVLCEKPFAMNLSEARVVLASAETSGKRVIEAFHHYYHPAHAEFRKWVAEGEIGHVTGYEGVFNVAIGDKGGKEIRHLPETGGGAMMDLGCYPLAFAMAVFEGTPEVVHAEAVKTPRGVDESMAAELSFGAGAKAVIRASMAADKAFEARCTVIGENGTIRFDRAVHPHDRGELVLERDGVVVRRAEVDRVTTYSHQLNAVVAALKSGKPLPTEGDAILRQQSALDAIYKAAGLEHLRVLAN